ncbi:MAG: glycoside hydrolase family 43 protein [Telluria sp.]
MNQHLFGIDRNSIKPLPARLAALCTAALLASGCAHQAARPTNPIGDFPDPFVLADGAGYYAYATNANGKNVQLLQSSDLRAWRALPDAMPALASWVRKEVPHVWAPEVVKLGNRYVLYYTAHDLASDRQCVGAAESGSPAGPFVDAASKPLVCQADLGGTIDASPFLDGGRLYLYFKSDGNCCKLPTHIFAQELRPDGLGVVGAPSRLLTNGRTWEGKVIEAPTMLNRDGKYTLLYSANDFGDGTYAAGYAQCAGPLGPCQPAGDAPFLKTSKETGLFGPGHQGVFRVGAQDYIAYHAWELKTDGKRGDRRVLYIDKLDWVDGKPLVRGPTLAR